MFDRIFSATLALALIASSPVMAADPKGGRDHRRELRQSHEPVPDQDIAYEPDVLLFWRPYGWPGGQAGPCWRLWYGQWVWSC